MSRRHSRITHVLGMLAGLIVVAATMATGCTENPVGRKCFLGDEVDDTQAIIASPALECPSRTCLQVPLALGKQLPDGGVYTPQCTAECESDDDCDRVPESPCITGFTCAIPVVVGPFCCRKLCVCRDYLIIPDGGVPVPEACKADNPENTCPNI